VRQKLSPENLVDINRLRAAFQLHRRKPGAGNLAAEMSVGSGRNDDLTWAGLRGEARGDVDGIADRRVVHAAFRAEKSDDGFTGVDTDSDVERGPS